MKVEDILSGGRKRRNWRGSRNKRITGIELAPIKLKKLGESGAMEGVGAIHISEIKPTLARLEKDLGVDLQNHVLGSVGKKEFSGDIDVAMQIPDDEIPAFIERVSKSGIVDEARKGPLVVISRVEIQGYNPDIKTDKPRTGFVQVDFMIDEDPNWLKTFYHSPSDKESKYKGAHRNIVLGALTKHVNPIVGKEKTPDGRPVEVERYMFSSKLGLVRVMRRLKPRKDGKGYTKAWENEVIGGPWKTNKEIVEQLNLGDPKNLNSFETVFAAIEKYHGKDVAAKVAQDLANDPSLVDLGMPDEAKKYL